ncbi:MAG: hypothetical protein IJ350_03195 [Clostridia bacterium]|nr:hypothetical protein [Clostridia bacterium]
MLLIPRVFKRKARFVGEGFKPGDYGKVAARNIRSERMTSSVELPFMEDTSVFDANTMGVERRRNRRSDRHHEAVGRNDTGRAPAVGHEGMSGTAACVALVCLIAVLGVTFLVGRSNVIEAGKKANELQQRIEEISLMNEGIETQLAVSASEVNVGYEAVQMGMISAKGVDVIYLNAPEAANMQLTGGATAALNGEYLATILGD